MSCKPDCPSSCTGEANEDAVQPVVGCAPPHLIKAIRDETYAQGGHVRRSVVGVGMGDWLSSVLLLGGGLALLVAITKRNPKNLGHNPGNPGHKPGNPIGEYKARQVPPKRFKRMRRIDLTEGVSAVVGFPGGARKRPGKGRSEIQSLRFDPAIFSHESARRWARVHGFKSKLD